MNDLAGSLTGPTILHRPRCPFSRRLRAYLSEKGLQAELVRFDPERHDADLRRVNPRAQLPIYEEPGGVALYESAIIMEYLEESHPEPLLMPADPKLRARTRLLYDLADQRLAAPLAGFARLRPDDPDRSARRADLIAISSDAERLLDPDDNFAFDGHFSFADLSVPPILFRAMEAGLALEELPPRLRGWLIAVGRRPSLRQLFPDVPLG